MGLQIGIVAFPGSGRLRQILLSFLTVTKLEDNCIQNFHLGGISTDIWSDI